LIVDEGGVSGYRILFEFVPGFEAVRAPFRVQILLYAFAFFVILSVLENSLLRTVTRGGRLHWAWPWVTSTLVSVVLVADMYRMPPTTWGSEDLLPTALQSQVTSITSSCECFVVDVASFPTRPDTERAVDTVMLSVLTGVPTANGYSRASPDGHPGFMAPADQLVAWMRAHGYQDSVCIVSEGEIRVTS
jgi:hypothetical protein